MLVDPTVERGCMIAKDGSVHPFRNMAADPRGLIQMGPDAFGTLCKLAAADNLHSWVHSHPFCAPVPSWIDIGMHDIPAEMWIYGVQEDRFEIYTNEEICKLQKGLTIVEREDERRPKESEDTETRRDDRAGG